jgi:putative flavoprotein involved in K+ transport
LNIAFELIDAYGQVGGAYARMCPNIILSSPGSYLSLPGLPLNAGKPNVSAAEFADYLVRYAKSYELKPVQTRVTSVKARNGAFLVNFDRRPAQSYRAVVVASGMCEHPNHPQIPGLVCPGDATERAPKAIHAQDWSGPDSSHPRILIIGRGMRAVEIAEECAAVGIRTVISTRQRKVRTWRRTIWGMDLRKILFPATRFLSTVLQRLIPRYCAHPYTFPGIDRGFAAYRSAGLIDVQGSVVRFEGHTAVFEDGARCEFDVVVAATGYRHLMPFLPADVARAPAGQLLSRNGQSISWPGLYVLGIPCASGVASQFIHGIKYDARAVATNIQQFLCTATKARRATNHVIRSYGLRPGRVTGYDLVGVVGARSALGLGARPPSPPSPGSAHRWHLASPTAGQTQAEPRTLNTRNRQL